MKGVSFSYNAIRADGPNHKQKTIYSLTDKAIALAPVFAHIGGWGRRYLPATKELSIRAQVLEEGGPAMWDQFMEELREAHLGRRAPKRGAPKRGATVAETLQAAYEAVVAEK